MASRQDKGEREEEAASGQEEGRQKMESHDRDYYEQGEQEDRPGPGVIGTILKSVADTLESAKEAVIGKPYDDEPRRKSRYEEEEEEKAGEMVKEKAETAKEKAKESAAEKARRAKEAMEEKAREAAEKAKRAKETVEEKARETKESAREGKDKAAEKGGEYKDYTVEKAEETKETKDSAVGKISETAKRAMEKLTGGWKDDEREEEPKEKYLDTEDEARRKMQELKLREEGYEDEDRKRAEAERETAEDR